MSRKHQWDIFSREEPTEIHHKSCEETPESYPTGDATEGVVLEPEAYAREGEEFDTSCECLSPVLGAEPEGSR